MELFAEVVVIVCGLGCFFFLGASWGVRRAEHLLNKTLQPKEGSDVAV